MSESTVTLDDIERLCWRLSGWSVEQRSVDELLAMIRAHMGCACPAPLPLASRGPGEWQGASADLAILDETPESTPERPVEVRVAAQAGEDSPQGTEGRQTGTQRLQLTGTFTFVCSGSCAAGRKQQTYDASTPRTCRTCGVTSPLGEFPRDLHSPQGHRTACRDCERKRHRDAARAKREQKAQAA